MKVRRVLSRIRNKFPKSLILVYHSIGQTLTNPYLGNNIHNVTPENFENQLLELKKEYSIIWIDELMERIRKGKMIDRLCSITLDDGYKSVFDSAYPILARLQVPATLFLVGNLIIRKTYWRDNIRLIINKKLEKEFLDFA